MKQTKRLFLALVLSDETKQQVNTWRSRNLDTLDHKRPVPTDNYHVTLVFIGTVTPEQLPLLIEEIKTVKADSFKLTIDKTDYWPQPKVLHLVPTIIPPKLIDLQRKVNKATERAGLPCETRPYRPHLTLYRKITPGEFEQLEEDGMPEPHTSIDIEQFGIYESVSDADGVHYELVEAFELCGAFA